MVTIVRRRLTPEVAAHVTRDMACVFRGSPRRRVICGSALIPWEGAQERLYFLVRGDIYSANENVGKKKRHKIAPTLESIGVWIPYRTFPTFPYKAEERIAAHNPCTSVERSEESIEEAYEIGKTHHTPGFTGWDRDDRPMYIASTLHFADPGTGITENKRWWGPGIGWVHVDDMTSLTNAASPDPNSTNVNPVASSAEIETCLRRRLHVAVLGGDDANLDGQRQIQIEVEASRPEEPLLQRQSTLSQVRQENNESVKQSVSLDDHTGSDATSNLCSEDGDDVSQQGGSPMDLDADSTVDREAAVLASVLPTGEVDESASHSSARQSGFGRRAATPANGESDTAADVSFPPAQDGLQRLASMEEDSQEISLLEERTALPSTTTALPRPRYIRMPNIAYQAAGADYAARSLECLIVSRVLVVPKNQEASVWWLQNNLEWSAENFVWMSSMVRFTTVALNTPCLVETLRPITLPSDRGYLFGVWLPQVPYAVPFSPTLTSNEAYRLLRRLAWKIHAALDQDKYAVHDGDAPFHVVTPRPLDYEDEESEDEDEGMDEDYGDPETLDMQPSGNVLFDEV